MRKAAMTTCVYCGREITVGNQHRHQARCPRGRLREPLQEFMRRHAVDGVAMSCHTYINSSERKELNLPALTAIRKVFPFWEDFVRWCGLIPQCSSEAMGKGDWRKPLSIADERPIEDDLHTLKGYRQYSRVYRDLSTGQAYVRTFTELR